MARLISNGDHNWTASSWLVADTNGVVDSESSTLNITTSTTTHTTPTFTPGAITVDGICLKLASRAASPTGTFTVVLRNSTASSDVTSVVVNVSDLQAGGGWHYFKFASPQLLLAATNYAVRLTCSVSSEVAMYRVSLQNFSKLIVTTTTAATAANDQTIITKAYTGTGASTASTVTMDNTASTVFGGVAATYVDALSVSGGGVLTWGTSASTNYLLTMKGLISIWEGSTWNMGTSGTRVPSTSTAKLAFSVASNVDSGFVAKAGSTVNIYGATKTNWAYTITDAAGGSTAVVPAAMEGWVVGDQICIASTTRTYTQAEVRTIDALYTSPDRPGFTPSLSYTHSGTSPTQAEVGNLTRNVSIFGTSTTLQGYVNFASTSSLSIDSCEFYYLGSSTSNKAGFEVFGTGSCTITGCSFHEFLVSSSKVSLSRNDQAISDCVFFQQHSGVTASGSAGTFDGCLVIGGSSSLGSSTCIFTTANQSTISNSNFANLRGTYGVTSSSATWSNCVIHSCESGGGYGIGYNNTVSSLSVYRNGANGLNLAGVDSNNIIYDSCLFFGNATAGINLFTNGTGEATFNDCVIAGDSSFAQTRGLNVSGLVFGRLIFNNCTFGVASGIYVAHSSEDIYNLSNTTTGHVCLRNCVLASSTEVLTTNSQYCPAFIITSQSHDQTSGLHKTWTGTGRTSTNTSTYRTTPPSIESINNGGAAVHRATYFGRHFMVPVDSGQSATVSIYYYKASGGGSVTLRLLANPALGIDDDVVLDTDTTATTGAWTLLSGTTPTVSDDGVLEVTIEHGSGTIYYSDFAAA